MKPSSVAGTAGPQASLLAALVGRDCQGSRKTTAGTEARGQRLGTSPADSERPPTPTPGDPLISCPALGLGLDPPPRIHKRCIVGSKL